MKNIPTATNFKVSSEMAKVLPRCTMLLAILCTLLMFCGFSAKGAVGDFQLDVASISVAASGPAATQISGFAVVMQPADNAPWTATSDSAWVKILSGAAGTKAGPVSLLLSDNNSVEARQGTITVKSTIKTVILAINQAGRSATVTPLSFNFPALGGNGEVRVVTGNGFSWLTSLKDPWVSSDNLFQQIGPGVFGFRVQPNGLITERLGTFVVAGKIISIRQDGIPLVVNPRQVVVDDEGEIRQFKAVALESTRWEVVSTTPWIQVLDAGSGFGEGVVTVFMSENSLFRGRQGSFSIGGQSISVSQSGNQKPFLSISPASGTSGSQGAGGAFNVTSGADTPWSASTKTPWIGLSAFEGVGQGQVRLVVAPNNTTSPRTGSIQVVTARPLAPLSVRRGLLQHIFSRRPRNAMTKPWGWEGIDRNHVWDGGKDYLNRADRESFRFIDGPRLVVESSSFPVADFGFNISFWFSVDYTNRVNQIMRTEGGGGRKFPPFTGPNDLTVVTGLDGALLIDGQNVINSLIPGGWYRVSLAWSQGDATTRYKIYNQNTQLVTGSVGVVPRYPKRLVFAESNQMIGNIDNIKIYNRSLQPYEEEVVYQSELAGQDERWFDPNRNQPTGDSLIGHWAFNESAWDELGNGWKLQNLTAVTKDLVKVPVHRLQHERGDRDWHQVGSTAARIVTESDRESTRFFSAIYPEWVWWFVNQRAGWNEWGGPFPTTDGAFGIGWPQIRSAVRAWSGTTEAHNRASGQITDLMPESYPDFEKQFFSSFSFDPSHPFVGSGALPMIGPGIRDGESMTMQQKADQMSISFWTDSFGNLMGVSRRDAWRQLRASCDSDGLTVNGVGVKKPIPAGWNHYVFTWKIQPGGYAQSIYVNTELFDKRTVIDSDPWIRKDVWKVIWFENLVDDIRVYDQELTPQDVSEINAKERSAASTYTLVQAPSIGTLSKTAFEVASSGGILNTALDINAETVWIGNGNSPWLNFIDSGNLPTNRINSVGSNPQIVLKADPNPDIFSRTGRVTIANIPLAVVQGGKMIVADPGVITAGPDPGGATIKVSVGTGTAWTISCNQDWISLPEKRSYSGTDTIFVSYSRFNSQYESRTAIINVGSQEVYLVQRGYSSTVSPTVDRVMGAGAIRKVTVTVPGGAVWQAFSRVPWITIMSQQFQSGSGTVEYQVNANSGELRTGKLVIAGTEVTVTQNAYNASATGLTLAIADLRVLSGQTVSVPVLVSGFNAVAGAQLSLTWDPSVLRFSGIRGMAPFNLGVEDLTFTTNSVGTNAVGIVWFDLSLGGITLSNGTSLCEVQFLAVGSPGTFSAISHQNQPIPTQFVNASLDGIASAIQPGSVTLDNTLRFTGSALYAGTTNPIPRLSAFGPDPSSPTVVSNSVFTFGIVSGLTFTAKVEVNESTNSTAGVNVLDILALKRHLLGRALLQTGWQFAAADVDDDGTLNVVDILKIQRAILSRTTPGWRMFGGASTQVTPSNYRGLPSTITYPNYTQELTQEVFRGVKKGDVNLDWISSSEAKVGATKGGTSRALASVQSEAAGLSIEEVDLTGQFRVGLHFGSSPSVEAIQLAVRLPAQARNVRVIAPRLSGFNANNFLVQSGVLTIAWTADGSPAELKSGQPVLWISGSVDGLATGEFIVNQDDSFEAKVVSGGENGRSLVVEPARFSLGWGRFVDAMEAIPVEPSVAVPVQRVGSYRLMQSEDLRSWQPVLEGYFHEGIHRIRIESEGPQTRFYQIVPLLRQDPSVSKLSIPSEKTITR